MRSVVLIALFVIIPPVLAFTANRWIVARAEELPSLGPVDGALQGCPPGLDCVGSGEPDEPRVAVLPFDGSADDLLRRWAAVAEREAETTSLRDQACGVVNRSTERPLGPLQAQRPTAL